MINSLKTFAVFGFLVMFGEGPVFDNAPNLARSKTGGFGHD